MRKTLLKIITTILTLSIFVQANGQIVVNIGSGVEKLSKEEIKTIFNLQKLKWDNGTSIHVYLLPSAHETQEEFCKKILDTSANAVQEKWMAYILNGGVNKPPKSMKERKMLRMLQKQKGAIGILPLDTELPENTISILKL